jgi:putative transposase
MQAEIKDACWALFDTEDLETRPGPRLVELADHRITEMADRYSATYPAAMKCLLADREGLTACLRLPAEHHHRIRHSNFERTFGETRRRIKVIGRLPGATSCLTVVWAVLDRASAGWRGLTMPAGGLRLLQDLRRSLPGPPRQLRPRTNRQPGRRCPSTLRVTKTRGWGWSDRICLVAHGAPHRRVMLRCQRRRLSRGLADERS